MKPTLFTGSGVALATPFAADGIDQGAMRQLIDWQIEEGTDALIVLGTTGEPSTMTDAEREGCIALALEQAHGRVPVIVGVGTNDTVQTVARAKMAAHLGANGLLAVTPYYNRPSPRGMLGHFTALADATNLPIILYNVPSRTGTNMSAELVAKLSEHENIAGLKEANGNLAQMAELINLTDGELPIYSGNDEQTLTIMALGGVGVISVAANIIPRAVHEMAVAMLEGDMRRARALQLRYHRLMQLLFIEPSPAPLKAAMRMMELCNGRLRLPLAEIEASSWDVLQREMERLALVSN